MSLGDWTSWNNRASRPRESVADVFVPASTEPMLADEPMEVQEDVLSQTGIQKFWQRIVARKP